MKKSLPLILAISILFKGCINAKETPQPKNLTLNHKVAIQRVDSLLTSFDFYKRFSGTVLIAHADSIWYSNSFGYGDYEKDQKNSDGSVYGIASCTKQFTAAAILKLVQNGKINLNDNLFSFFPRLGSESRKVTIHNLLSHSSGISKDIGRGDTWDEIVFPQADPISMDSLIHFFGEITLDFTPGNKFDYNNHNYVLLAGIIEKVSGMDYQSYMKTNFFNPLGLKSTFFNQINRGDNQISKPYNNLPISYGQPEFWDDSWETGAGGIYSSAYDIYKWLKDLNRNRVLSPEQTRKMFESYQPDGKEYYGYGWQIADLFNNKYIYHDGGLNGYYCKIGFIPSQQVYVIVLSNHTHNLMELGNTSRFIGNINKQILNILFDQPYEKLPVPVAESQQDMNGRVEINGKTFLVSTPNGKILSIQAEGDYSVFDLPFTKSFSEKSKRFSVVEKVVKAYGEHDFKTVLDNSTAILRALVSEKKLAEIWSDLAGDTGDLISWNCYQLPSDENPQSYFVRMVYQKKEIGMQLVFKGKKVNGMFTDKTFSYNGPECIECTALGENRYFIDGFTYGHPDGMIHREKMDYVLNILNRQYRMSFIE